MEQNKKKISFYFSVVLLVLSIVVIYTCVSLLVLYFSISQSVLENSKSVFKEKARTTEMEFKAILKAINDDALLIDSLPNYKFDIDLRYQNDFDYLFTLLKLNSDIYSIYFGNDRGEFVQAINLGNSDSVKKTLFAPENCFWAFRIIRLLGEHRVETYVFFDEHFNPIRRTTNEEVTYDPRERAWFKNALNSEASVLSEPYIFNSSREPGISLSKKLSNTKNVLGIDLSLRNILDIIARTKSSEHGGIVVFDAHNQVLGLSPDMSEALMVRANTLQKVGDSETAKLLTNLGLGFTDLSSKGKFAWLSQLDLSKDYSIKIALLSPMSDFSYVLDDAQKNVIMANLGIMILILPFLFLIVSRMSNLMTRLGHDAIEVANFNFDIGEHRSSKIREIDQLSTGFNFMKSMIIKRNEELAVSQEKLAKIVEIGIAMSAERESNKLMQLLLSAAKELSHADGGTLYLKNSMDELDFQIVMNDSLKIHQGGTSANPINLPAVPLYSMSGDENHHNIVTHCFHNHTTISIEDAYNEKKFDFTGTKEFDKKTGYHSKSFLTVPLIPRGGNPIGAIQLINSISNDQIVPFSTEIQRFVEALSAAAATALYNRELLETQKALFDSLVQFIAGAIDTKSPYTGGHCARVPVLALMLAREANRVETGKLSDFRFENDDEWREFRIAAWLHDCGKVTTPEFVVDKATKLETIYNRIHEIRTRFEVVLRDAKIAQLQKIHQGANPAQAEAEFETFALELKEEFAFVAECNLGGEFMDPERIKKLETISSRTWERNFDERLGLSWEELKRYEGYNPRGGSVTEKLIDDKSYHKIPRTGDFYKAYEGKGFVLPVPELLYNRGELYNLGVTRGTLTNEERFKINEHIMQTIVMLEKLPLPDGLRRIPEYAGTHHEALSGKGYPRGFKEGDKEMSIPARIMAIADIFEALTAADRPYKKAKTLSESVKILHGFKKDNHIDQELFDLFLESGVYKEYGKRYLRPEQIDEVDISQFLG